MTQKDLAARISGLSQSNLSKYEKGLGGISENVKSEIMRTLNFPIGFLDIVISNNAESKHYRKKASISASGRRYIDRWLSLFAYMVDWLSDFVEMPDYNLGDFNLDDGTQPEEAARQIRRKLHLGNQPLLNICNIVERNGVLLYFWDCPYDDFDGVSLITDKGNRLAIINGNRDNERIRFTVAHELGHILMHECTDFFISQARDKESEANRFASELLMPESAIRNQLVGLKMKQLITLKGYWHTSMSAIVERARRLNAIDEKKYTQMRIEFSRNHWNKKEPYETDIDNPVVISQAFFLVKDGLGYDIDDMEKASCVPKDFITESFIGKTKIIRLCPNA